MFSNDFHLFNTLIRPDCLTKSPDDELVMEWWIKDKKLTLYAGKDRITFVKVINESIQDMNDGSIPYEEFTFHWISNLMKWLYE